MYSGIVGIRGLKGSLTSSSNKRKTIITADWKLVRGFIFTFRITLFYQQVTETVREKRLGVDPYLKKAYLYHVPALMQVLRKRDALVTKTG